MVNPASSIPVSSSSRTRSALHGSPSSHHNHHHTKSSTSLNQHIAERLQRFSHVPLHHPSQQQQHISSSSSSTSQQQQQQQQHFSSSSRRMSDQPDDVVSRGRRDTPHWSQPCTNLLRDESNTPLSLSQHILQELSVAHSLLYDFKDRFVSIFFQV